MYLHCICRMVMEFHYNTYHSITQKRKPREYETKQELKVVFCADAFHYYILLMHFWSPKSNLFSMNRACSLVNEKKYVYIWINRRILSSILDAFFLALEHEPIHLTHLQIRVYKICTNRNVLPNTAHQLWIIFFK